MCLDFNGICLLYLTCAYIDNVRSHKKQLTIEKTADNCVIGIKDYLLFVLSMDMFIFTDSCESCVNLV